MDPVFEKARLYLYRNARPLEMARWQYHFGNGQREAVLEALAAYQNEDGGFGHALEPDCWNPASSPIQTWAATEILRETDCFDAAQPRVEGILRYLQSGEAFDGRTWRITVPGNNDHPRAPWWTHQSEPEAKVDYNPTAALAGFMLRAAAPGTSAHRLALGLANEAMKHLLFADTVPMHTLHCFAELLEDAGASCAALDTDAPERRLRDLVAAAIHPDPSAWENSYVCKPSLLVFSRRSPFYGQNRDTVARECAFIRRTQLEDGSWPLTWSWDAYPEAWAVSSIWWKGHAIIENLRYIREMEPDSAV